MYGLRVNVPPSLKIGDKVLYRGAWGREPAKPGTIVGIDEKNGREVYDVECDDGDSRWGYANQFTKRGA